MSLIKSLTFNSKTNSDKLNFNIPHPIYISEGFAISQFNSVHTVYNVSERNNNFSFIESDTPGTTRTLTIPVGNYILSSYMSVLSTLLNSSGTNAYTVSNNALTNRISIIAATKTFKIVAVLKDTYNEAGFTISSAFALTQTASSTYDLSGLKTINICSNSFGVGNCITIGSNMNIIASIPITVSYLGVISYNPNVCFISSQISEINAASFIFTDELYRTITLDKDYSLTVLLSQ